MKRIDVVPNGTCWMEGDLENLTMKILTFKDLFYYRQLSFSVSDHIYMYIVLRVPKYVLFHIYRQYYV